MLTRPRLRSHAGCVPCKKRRKKCDEQKPTCGACQRVNRHCSWISDKDTGSRTTLIKFSDPVCEFFIRRLRQEPTLSKSIDLSAFQDRICASHMLETCFKVWSDRLRQTLLRNSCNSHLTRHSIPPTLRGMAGRSGQL